MSARRHTLIHSLTLTRNTYIITLARSRTHTRIHAQTHTYTRVRSHTHTHTHTRTHTYTRTYTHIPSHGIIHIYAHENSLVINIHQCHNSVSRCKRTSMQSLSLANICSNTSKCKHVCAHSMPSKSYGLEGIGTLPPRPSIFTLLVGYLHGLNSLFSPKHACSQIGGLHVNAARVRFKFI